MPCPNKFSTPEGVKNFKKKRAQKNNSCTEAATTGDATIGLEDDLNQFTGTTRYFRHFTGLLYTDGVQFLAERAGAYWLIDLVGSYQNRLKHVPFQFWEMKVKENKSALVTMVEDTGRPVLVRQEIPYTDFPLPEFSWYCYDSVMMLKSEY